MNPDHPRFTPRSHGGPVPLPEGQTAGQEPAARSLSDRTEKGENSRAKREPSQDHFLSSNKNPEGREKGKGET